MRYSITIQEILPPLEGEKYDRNHEIYSQEFEVDDIETKPLEKIIKAVNDID